MTTLRTSALGLALVYIAPCYLLCCTCSLPAMEVGCSHSCGVVMRGRALSLDSRCLGPSASVRAECASWVQTTCASKGLTEYVVDWSEATVPAGLLSGCCTRLLPGGRVPADRQCMLSGTRCHGSSMCCLHVCTHRHTPAACAGWAVYQGGLLHHHR
jgi:hypothetical protein